MAEYIERQNLIEMLRKNVGTYNFLSSPTGYIVMDKVYATIDKIPVADVVEVIRCKNCRYYNRRWGCRKLEINVSADNYCFMAEPAVADSEVTLPGEE